MRGGVAAALAALALLAAALAPGPAARAAEAPPRLAVAGPAETVFRWSTDRCDALHIPDSPARALRLPDGTLALLAAHLTNMPLLGGDFASLAPACATGARGAENPDPAAFDDRFWVQALAPLPDGRVLGLASHEYMGGRHRGRCAVETGPAAFRCWQSAIIATVAAPGDAGAAAWRFHPLPMPALRVVAASHAPYDPAATRRSGFFSVTNIVFAEGHAWLLAYTEGVPGQPAGMCLLRAPREDLLGGWRALAGGRFGLHPGARPRDPAVPCDPVGAGSLAGVVRSVVRVVGRDGGGSFLAVFAGTARDAESGASQEGVFVSTSPDLRQWSAPRLLLAARPFNGQPEPGTYMQYPSLIDHASTSPVFDTTDGTALHLYLTRFNLAEDRRRGMDRDLIRIPLTLGPANPAAARAASR